MVTSVVSQAPLGVDARILLYINHLRSPILDSLMPVVSYPGPWWGVVGAFVLWRLWRGGRKELVFWVCLAAVAGLSDVLCAKVMKPLFGRARPFITLDDLWVYRHGRFVLTDPAMRQGFSMSLAWPSCHAMNMASAAGFACVRHPSWLWGMVPLVLLVSYSRLYLGLHYPLDVVGGMVLGGAWGTAWGICYRRVISSGLGLFSHP